MLHRAIRGAREAQARRSNMRPMLQPIRPLLRLLTSGRKAEDVGGQTSSREDCSRYRMAAGAAGQPWLLIVVAVLHCSVISSGRWCSAGIPSQFHPLEHLRRSHFGHGVHSNCHLLYSAHEPGPQSCGGGEPDARSSIEVIRQSLSIMIEYILALPNFIAKHGHIWQLGPPLSSIPV